MSKHAIATVLAVLALCVFSGVHADEATDLFARYKAASGGERWDSVKSQRMTGTLTAGGLSGAFEALQDLSTGRSSDHYQLGPVEGADGYDGKVGWSRDPGGEVAALDAPEAKRRARSQAWLDARGYWYPARIGARYGKMASRELEGRRYAVVEATADGGDPLTLWFDAQTSLLARTVQRQGQDTATTVFDDWRDVDGLRLPFHSITDLTDAAGRTDPRQRNEVRLQKITSNVALADADFAMPAMAATAKIDDASGITRIPFDLVNNHIYVDGAIDGKKARFLVDTGGLNLLTPAAASKLGITGEGKLAARGVGDQSVDLAFAHAKEVRVGNASLANPVFYVIDLGDLPKVEGVVADGLVGYEMFRRFGITIDYAAHVLTLSDPKKFAPPAGASAIAFELDDRIPIVNGVLDGVPASITVDTGSRSSLTLHSPFVHAHHLATKYRAAPEAVIGWGVGGPSRGRPVRLGTLKLGDLSIDGIAGELFTGDKGSFANPDHAGNLGGGVLGRFTVAFDYAAKRMYLAPNDRFGKPDGFDRSGLWLLGDGDALKVADVAGSSTAERAGLRKDDRIVAIGDEGIEKRGLPEWRQRLRELPVGAKLTIRYLRAGKAGKAGKAELVLADRIAPAWKSGVVE
ncbi:aspartyl protease family protein [Dokdonella soli]|uniref:PDZ domain-containing protein n=1 Tax=Dokdonella soli TaxID=529810 RepID=A0ABN1IET5_9GAMM